MTSNISLPVRVVTEEISKTYADFSFGGAAKTITLITPPADTRVIALSCECTIVPAGGTLATYTVESGDATDPNGYEVGADHIAGGVGMYETLGAWLTTTGRTVTAATAIQATATAAGDTLDNATQGAWTWKIAYIQY
jgi:hypothetical protein